MAGAMHRCRHARAGCSLSVSALAEEHPAEREAPSGGGQLLVCGLDSALCKLTQV